MSCFIRMYTLVFLSGFSWASYAEIDFDADHSPESRAMATLKQYLSLPAKLGGSTGIHVIESEALDWIDASLGCPQPGRSYDQVITPGHRVILSYQDQDYNVHLSERHALVCTLPDGILPAPAH